MIMNDSTELAKRLAAAERAATAEMSARRCSEESLRQLQATLERRIADGVATAERRATQWQSVAAKHAQIELRDRRRLAQLLHEHLQQLLVVAKMKVFALRKAAPQDAVLAAAEQVDGLLDQCIAHSRSLAVQLSPPVLYDAGLVPALQWLSRQMRQKHDLRIDIRLDGAVEPADEEIRVLLYHAVQQLLDNIVEHAGVGRAQLDLAPLDNEHVQITVSDQGVGFDPDVPPHGDMLGLLAVRASLEMFGGQLCVQSALGQGTCVRLIAPLRVTPAHELPPLPNLETPPVVEHANATHAAGTPVRVVLADDHPILRKGLCDILQGRHDIELVGVACDGQEAVDLALKNPPDVILMDVTMPRLDGIAATRQITARLPRVRVIGLSMHEEKDMAAAMRAAGAAEFLTKGVSAALLIATILGPATASAVAVAAE
jgi:signal transduction histidine kinase